MRGGRPQKCLTCVAKYRPQTHFRTHVCAMLKKHYYSRCTWEWATAILVWKPGGRARDEGNSGRTTFMVNYAQRGFHRCLWLKGPHQCLAQDLAKK